MISALFEIYIIDYIKKKKMLMSALLRHGWVGPVTATPRAHTDPLVILSVHQSQLVHVVFFFAVYCQQYTY